MQASLKELIMRKSLVDRQPDTKPPEPVCKGCGMLTVDRIKYIMMAPDCPVHGIVTSYERNAENVVYPEGM